MPDDEMASSLTKDELRLLRIYLRRASDIPGETVADVLTGEGAESGLSLNIEDLLPFVSNSLDSVDLQSFALLRSKGDIIDKLGQVSTLGEGWPDDASVTPEKINRLLLREEITLYFNLIGTLIEQLSTELIIRKVVDGERESRQIRRDIENKSQAEREWLLYVTGVLSQGDKGEIRRAYQIRSALIHDRNRASIFNELSNIESDIERSFNAVDALHENLTGISVAMRISDQMMNE